MHFTAIQVFRVSTVAFEWRARFPLLGRLALHVVDRYADGEGEPAVRLLGLPLQRQRGSEVAVGEALRYLAEIPWVPHAMLANHQLAWRQLDERRVEVATQLAGRRVVAELLTDETCGVVACSSAMRKRRDGRSGDAMGRRVRRVGNARRAPCAHVGRGVLGAARRPLRLLPRPRDVARPAG